jgi:hypothetical protein
VCLSTGSLDELDEDGGHVVAAQLLEGAFSDEAVEELLHEFGGVLLVLPPVNELVDHELAIVYVSLPNAIAAHYDELVIGVARHLLHVRVAGNHLVFVAQTGVALVLEVA